MSKVAKRFNPFATAPFLTIIFIILKVSSQIDWPWIWVLCPLWIPAAVCILIFAILFLIVGTTDL